MNIEAVATSVWIDHRNRAPSRHEISLAARRNKGEYEHDPLENMIRIGPAGWAYKDWEGIVYPPDKPKGFDPVRYLAQYFDTIEINSSYYGPPRSQAAKSWAERASGNPRFKFTAKLYKAFTHDRKAGPEDEQEFKDGI